MASYRKSILVVVLGDVAVLLFFTVGGVTTHESDSADPIGNVIRTLVPFAIVWFITASLIGVYRSNAIGSPRRALRQTLMATLIANPLAVLLRAFLINRTTIPTSFLAVTLGLNIVLYVAWHVGYAGWRAHRSHE